MPVELEIRQYVHRTKNLGHHPWWAIAQHTVACMRRVTIAQP